MKMKSIIVLFLVLAGWNITTAQNDQAIKSSSFTVKGTSTLHDWEMTSESAKGHASFVMEDNKLVAIRNLNLSIITETLKSDKDGMNKNAYKALKSSQHKKITFTLDKVLSLQPAGDSYLVTAGGKLQMAGSTQTVSVKAICRPEKDGTLRVKGEKALKMTSFNVEPPSFMLGSVKTGDEVTILFNVVFSSESIVSKN